MKALFIIFLLICTVLCISIGVLMGVALARQKITPQVISPPSSSSWWSFQSIDTMKYSRDPSRQFLSDPTQLQQLANEQIKNIASSGATYVAIATPYDDEFLPVLKEWVSVARQYHLHIWFRGNWSGWEGWFGYPKISRQEHIQKTVAFIHQHSELFEDGDIFSACPECENGGPGDPRQNGDVQGHRQFLIAEYQAITMAFQGIHKNVAANFNSMNGDVARLIMDKPTTKALGGIVVVDHYVKTPQQLNQDVTEFAQLSGGKVVLGEFGAPIPDINGQMSDAQQAAWIKETLGLLANNPNLYGLNYWTSVGGSTAIWNDDGSPKPAIGVFKSYYSPSMAIGTVTNTLGEPLDSVLLQTAGTSASTDSKGSYALTYLNPQTSVTISATNYQTQQLTIAQLLQNPQQKLTPTSPSIWYLFNQFVHDHFAKNSL